MVYTKYAEIGLYTPVLIKGDWAASTVYAIGNLVYSTSVTTSYICIAAHTSSAAGGAGDEPGVGANSATYWQTFFYGPAGAKGDSGTPGSMTWHGAWSGSSHAYAANDLVSHAKTGYGSQTYICISAHTSGASSEPEVGGSWATYWAVFGGGGADGVGSGDVVGVASSTSGNVVIFGDTSGKHIHDAGYAGHAAAADDAFNGLSAVTTAPTVDYQVLVYNGSAYKKMAINNFRKCTWPASISAKAINPRNDNGCGAPTQDTASTNKQTWYSCSFSNGALMYGNFNFILPPDYTGGTVDAYVYWYSKGVTSNSVRWGIQARAYADNDATDAAWGNIVEVTDTATGTAKKRLKSPVLSSITIGGTPSGGQEVFFQIYRNPAHGDDNLDEAVYLSAILLLIPVQGTAV